MSSTVSRAPRASRPICTVCRGATAHSQAPRGAAKFLDALFVRGRLLRPDFVQTMIRPTPQSLAHGPEGLIKSYGMGTGSYDAAGRVWYGHDGSYVGFNAMAATDVERGVSIAVVTNRQLGNANPALVLWLTLAEAYGG
jgi:D-alanyl-D-alanine carboxypeptidase